MLAKKVCQIFTWWSHCPFFPVVDTLFVNKKRKEIGTFTPRLKVTQRKWRRERTVGRTGMGEGEACGKRQERLVDERQDRLVDERQERLVDERQEIS